MARLKTEMARSNSPFFSQELPRSMDELAESEREVCADTVETASANQSAQVAAASAKPASARCLDFIHASLSMTPVSLKALWSLFVPERVQRVHFCRPARRNPTGHQRH